jgi:predicted DNA-binding transcriptional regulator AlpA
MKPKDASPTSVTNTLLSDLLTPAQLAAELGVTERCIHRWHALRQGPPRIVLGRRPFYRRSSVATWIEGRERDPAAETRGRRRRATATSPAA